MTDYDSVKEMLTKFGVGFKEEGSVVGDRKFIGCEAAYHSKVTGYSGLSQYYVFDRHGEFLRIELGAE